MRVLIAFAALIALCTAGTNTPAKTFSEDELHEVVKRNYENAHQAVEDQFQKVLDMLKNETDVDPEKIKEFSQKVVDKLEKLVASKEFYDYYAPLQEQKYEEAVQAAEEKNLNLEKDILQKVQESEAKKEEIEEKFIQKLTEASKKIDAIKTAPVALPSGAGCESTMDCLDRFTCQPLHQYLEEYLEEAGKSEKYEIYSKQLQITGNECVLDLQRVLDETDPAEFVGRLDAIKNEIVNKAEGFQLKLAKYNLTADMSWLNSEEFSDNLNAGSMSGKINQLSLVARGRENLDVDELLMMLINKDPIQSMLALDAKVKGDKKVERLAKSYLMMDQAKSYSAPMAKTGDAEDKPAIDPMMLMLMMGDGDIDPMMLMLMMGGDIDPLMMMLMMGDGEMDPMMLMLMMGD